MNFREILMKTFAQAIPILITALLSVAISILQTLLANYIGAHQITSSPESAGIIGAGLKAIHSATSTRA